MKEVERQDLIFPKTLFPEILAEVQSNKPGMNQTNICKP